MLPFHPLANIFPLIEGSDFDALVADIKANGVVDPIDTFEGMILDGRNRSRACEAAGIDAPTRPFEGTREQALGYVISKNLKRRHLNESQRSVVAARLANMRQGERTDLEPSANLPKVDQATAAGLLNVSERLVRDAKAVIDRGEPELARAVEQGKIAASQARKAVDLSPEQQRKVAEEAEAGRANVVRTVIKRETRDAREKQLGERQRALPQKKYGVIYADPEWQFEPYSRETGLDRAADNHYPTSDTLDIIARPVETIADKDCVLFLWATAPMLPQALRVMSGWGFTYKTHCVWHKLRAGDGRGSGYWFTGEHELLLVGSRGSVPAPATALCGSVIASTVGRHSEKPDGFAEMIEDAFPSLPKIELNARRARAGWDAWGLEAPLATEPEAEDGAAASETHEAEDIRGAHPNAGDNPELANPASPGPELLTSHVGGAGSPADEMPDIPAFLRRAT